MVVLSAVNLTTLLLLTTVPIPDRADVLVYGSTPGGFCAAIAAAREGASVLLLEPTTVLGEANGNNV